MCRFQNPDKPHDDRREWGRPADGIADPRGRRRKLAMTIGDLLDDWGYQVIGPVGYLAEARYLQVVRPGQLPREWRNRQSERLLGDPPAKKKRPTPFVIK
jgi:hypothetical protein